MPHQAEILAVGTELLLGNIANTNAQFLSELLASAGIDVLYHTAVGDNPRRLRQAVEIARQAGVELADYFARPELAVYNAIPTAEGCIGILLQQRTRTLWGAEVLVLGFGPVGQALAVRLSALGAGVTVCARRPEQRALAESLGLRAAPLTALAGLAPAFDTVVNTIPAPVLGDGVLARLRSGSLIVDLASKPGGTDFAAAARRGHRAIHALSLPAACAPETAGEAVARTVQTMLQEREGRTR